LCDATSHKMKKGEDEKEDCVTPRHTISPERKWRMVLRSPYLLRRFYRLNISITLWTGELEVLRCPFHDDHRPSAKVYRNGEEGDLLYCFGCNRQYDSYDYVKEVLQEDPKLWVQVNFIDKEVLEAVGEFDIADPVPKIKREYSYEGETAQEKIQSYYNVNVCKQSE